jgi:hypothetical protein
MTKIHANFLFHETLQGPLGAFKKRLADDRDEFDRMDKLEKVFSGAFYSMKETNGADSGRTNHRVLPLQS